MMTISLRTLRTSTRPIPSKVINILMAMAGALMGMGKRSKKTQCGSLKVARKIGPIDFDPDGRCDPMDVSKHLTSDYVTKKLGICE